MPSILIDLSRKTAPEKVVGGKAFSTQNLVRLGIPCPLSMAIPVACFNDYVLGRDGSARIHQELRLFFSSFPSGQKFILRSSGIGEDSARLSFAGQFDSIVTDSSEKAFRANLKKCWDSFWSARNEEYQIQRGVLLAGMGVLVQPYYEALYSGVFFTRDPLGKKEAMVVEYHAGAGEALVQGAVIPERLWIRAGGKNGYSFSPKPSRGQDEVFFKHLDALIRRALRIEAQTGLPQDVEWIVTKENKLFLVQSRPITANFGQREKHLWSNANVNENFPEPVIPFIQSFAVKGYERYFRNLAKAFGLPKRIFPRLESAFRGVIGFHRNFMYYNLTHIYRLLEWFPFPRALRIYWDQFVGVYGQSTRRKSDSPENPLSRGETWRMFWNIAASFLSMPFRIARFERGIERLVSAKPKRLAECRDWISGFLDHRFNHWLGASLADAAAMFSYGLIRDFLIREGHPREMQILLAGIPHLVSHEPQVDLWKIARKIRGYPELSLLLQSNPKSFLTKVFTDPGYQNTAKAIMRYQERWGHRISGELLMTRPDYWENPSELVALLRGYESSDSPSPEAILKTKALEAERTLKEIQKKLLQKYGLRKGLGKKWTLGFLVFAVHQGVRSRERVRNQQARLYNACRKKLLILGGHLVEEKLLKKAEEVFFLEAEEALSPILLKREKTVQAVLRSRLSSRADSFLEKPPDQFLLEEGKEWRALNKNAKKTKPTGETLGMKKALYHTLRGECACEGAVEGRARILNRVSEMKRLKAGEILVTRQTDPGWAPIFPLIKGLIIERGGMLSHGAIIAREYGIPALVAVPSAMKEIPDGAWIRLDASRKKVSW